MLTRVLRRCTGQMADIANKRARMSATSPAHSIAPTKQPSTSSATIAVDDPCWGSPAECSLSHLLGQLDRSKTILHESDDYIVLNKPPDLRMDGNYPATVHKLLTYWFPPRSLLLLNDDKSPDDAATTEDSRNESLLKRIASIHQHNKQDPDCLRPCHQLDYATSGVLLIARNKCAANKARLAFEQRHVQKRYSALVHGHVCIQQQHDWPVIAQEQLQTTMTALESDYRSTRAKRRQDTWNGFQPPHAIFQQWKMHRKRNISESRGSKLTSAEWDAVWNELDMNDDDAPATETMSWAEIKAAEKTHQFERAADVYNGIAKGKLDATMINSGPLLPTFFRVANGTSDDDCIFYIFAPLAQAKDDFAMRIHANYHEHAPHTNLLCASNKDGLEFKPSLTQCRLDGNDGTALCHLPTGEPVTRVSLVPMTGRRHQLRVHMALLGHTIVGDQTYRMKEKAADGWAERMCLHSSSLALPVLDDGTACMKVEADSPFRVTADGGIKVRML